MGTNAGGINYLTPGTNWFNTFCYTPGKTSAPGKVINSFCENTDGTIWIGTDNKGLWNYNPHDQSFTPVYLDAKIRISACTPYIATAMNYGSGLMLTVCTG